RLQEEARYLRKRRGKLEVCSPTAGLVTTPRVKEKVGRYLQEGELICEIEDPDKLQVEIALDEPDLGRVEPGQLVELKARALPFETFQAVVSLVAPRGTQAEPGATGPKPARGQLPSTVTVYCKLKDSDTGLRPGLTGHARIFCGRRPPGEVLAERALRFLRTEF